MSMMVTARTRRKAVFLFGTTTAAVWVLSSLLSDHNAKTVIFLGQIAGFQPGWLPQPRREKMIRFPGPTSQRSIPSLQSVSVETAASGEERTVASESSGGASFVENTFIEYCPGCRWMTKSFWMATELMQSYAPEQLGQVTLIPSEPGTFNITARVDFSGAEDATEGAATVQLWDRKVDGGFPPIDLVEFRRRFQACLDGSNEGSTAAMDSDDNFASPVIEKYTRSIPQGDFSHIVIKYCPGSNYLLRAAYYGQELLTTFCEGELDAISLKPVQKNAPIGGFSVELLNDSGVQTKLPQPIVLWDNSESGRFPEVRELKRLVRDKVTPQKDLGHSEDRSSNNNTCGNEESLKSAKSDNAKKSYDCIPCDDATVSDLENKKTNEVGEGKEDSGYDDRFMVMDEDEAEEARRYFGVF